MAQYKAKTWRGAAQAVLGLAGRWKLQIDRLEDALRYEAGLRPTVPLGPSGVPKVRGSRMSAQRFLQAARRLVEQGHPALAAAVLDVEEFALPDQKGISRALLFGRTKSEAVTALEAVARDATASQEARWRALEEVDGLGDVLVGLEITLDFVRDQLKAGDLSLAARRCEEFYERLSRVCSRREEWWAPRDLEEVAWHHQHELPMRWGGESWQ